MLDFTVFAVVAAVVAGAAALLIRRRATSAALARARASAAATESVAREAASAHIAQRREHAERQAAELHARLRRALDEQQAEAAAVEQRLETREAKQAEKLARLEAREQELQAQYESLTAHRALVKDLREEVAAVEAETAGTIERVAGESRASVQARTAREIVDRARLEAQKHARDREDAARLTAEHDARRLIDVVGGRYGLPRPADRLIASVNLPRSKPARDRLLADDQGLLHKITELIGVEFRLVEDTDTFHMSAPDPYTREIGRLTYERLCSDRSPNEARVAKAVARSTADVERAVRTAGNRAAKLLHVRKVHKDILFLIGKLLYRTSYTQNQWQHAVETAYLAGMLAEEIGEDVRVARRAALLHDIGKVLYAESGASGSHALSGAEFAREHGEPPEIVHPIAAHHADEKPETALAHLVAAADALSGGRPGARRETIEAFTTRVDDLQRISGEFAGVDKSYVIQGGRELRIVVNPRAVKDADMADLSVQVARRVEKECIYPGKIKVMVLRETRVSGTAR